MKRRFVLGLTAAVLVLGLLLPQMALADKPLVIAFRGDAATLDPHGRNETTTFAIQAHFYDRLVKRNQAMEYVPDLAESWKIVNDLTWEFKLRPGLKFINGEPVNAEAAKYSLIRARTWKKSQWKHMVPAYKEIKIIDDLTFQIITEKPTPETLVLLNSIFMVPPKHFSTTDEAVLAREPVGSGAYKFIEWVKDDHVKAVANPNWHGGAIDFKDLLIRPIPEDATRVAALISGEVDVVWGVSIPDVPRIEKNKSTYVSRAPSTRAIYIMFDVHSDKGGKAPEGQPGIPAGMTNVFKEYKARAAIAHAINIKELIEYVMEGSAYPATELISKYAGGFNPNLTRPKYDVALAKKLWKEAGVPADFTAEFHCPNDRYINDQMMTEAIAAQLKKNLGLKLKVVARPKAVFFPSMNRREGPMFLAGWGTMSWQGTMNNFFRKKAGAYGRNNRGRFFDPKTADMLTAANSEMDKTKRNKLRWAASEYLYSTYFVIPLYYQENVIGFNNRIVGKARTDELLIATDWKKAK